MFALLKNGIRGKKPMFVACVLSSFVLYMAMLIILTYYCNFIWKNVDEDRYCYYDISLSEPVSLSDLEQMEKAVQNELAYQMGAVSYVSALEDFLWVLIVHSAHEVNICGSDLDLCEGAIVGTGITEEMFLQQYPDIQYQLEDRTIVYGSQPDFLAAIMSYEDAAQYNIKVAKIMIRTLEPLDFFERNELKKVLSQNISDFAFTYIKKTSQVFNALIVSRYYVVLSICVFVYTILCNMMLIYQLLKQQKRSLQVYLICGMRKKALRKFLLAEIFITQIAAAIFACICLHICMPLLMNVNIYGYYAAPYLGVLSGCLLSMMVAVHVARKYEKLYA